jgi:hypothetical protein
MASRWQYLASVWPAFGHRWPVLAGLGQYLATLCCAFFLKSLRGFFYFSGRDFPRFCFLARRSKAKERGYSLGAGQATKHADRLKADNWLYVKKTGCVR